jgi:hypothetical protein
MLSRRDFLTVLARVAPFAWALSPAGPIPRALAGPDRTSPGAIFALAGTVLPGRGDPLPGHAVLIRHGRIETVVPAGLPRDRPVVAPPDAWILPGVINAHCHHAHTPEDRRRLWLESGVTALGDAASPLAALPDLLRSPAGTTATASACGPMLAPPGGYPLNAHNRNMALEINSPARGEDAVRRLADLGAGSVKIAFEPGNGPAPLPLFDAATARAVCDTARRLGLGVRAHVQDLSGLEPALNAGVRTIEHVPHVLRTPDGPAPVLDKSGAVLPAYRALLERMARDGVILTPTLDVLSRTPWGGPALFEPVRTFHAMGGRGHARAGDAAAGRGRAAPRSGRRGGHRQRGRGVRAPRPGADRAGHGGRPPGRPGFPDAGRAPRPPAHRQGRGVHPLKGKIRDAGPTRA